MQSLHYLLTYVVHDIDYMLRYLLSIYLSSISISWVEYSCRAVQESQNMPRKICEPQHNKHTHHHPANDFSRLQYSAPSIIP